MGIVKKSNKPKAYTPKQSNIVKLKMYVSKKENK
jgi:hypothetical protein